MVTIPRLTQASLRTAKTAPLGPGAAFANVKDRTVNGIRAIMRKTADEDETGFSLGAMTSVPSISMEPDVVNILEPVVGLNSPLRGAQQPQSYGITGEVEIVEMRPETVHLLLPGMTETAWMNGTTPVEVGRTFRPKGFFSDGDYIDNLVFAFESTDTDLYMVITLFNCIQTDAFEMQPDDGGQVGGVAATFTSHCSESDFDVNTGTFLPPVEISWQAPSEVVMP